jgi:hypothetical protein
MKRSGRSGFWNRVYRNGRFGIVDFGERERDIYI